MRLSSEFTTSLHDCNPMPSRPGSFSHLLAKLNSGSGISRGMLSSHAAALRPSQACPCCTWGVGMPALLWQLAVS